MGLPNPVLCGVLMKKEWYSYLPAFGALFGELGEVDVLIWVLLAVLLAAHLNKECVVGHTSLWFLSFIGWHLI
jgi:hypothetical protein